MAQQPSGFSGPAFGTGNPTPVLVGNLRVVSEAALQAEERRAQNAADAAKLEREQIKSSLAAHIDKLFDEAEPKPGLGGHKVPQGALEGAVSNGIEGSEGQGARTVLGRSRQDDGLSVF